MSGVVLSLIHISLLEASGALLALNPGSPTSPREGRAPSAALLKIENGTIYPEIVLVEREQQHMSGTVSYTHLDVYKRQLYKVQKGKDAQYVYDDAALAKALKGVGKNYTCLLYTSRCV